MEEINNKKPCAVEKIETSQGFSVSYKEHFLYSKYNPSKNIISAIEKLQLLPGTLILCCSPLLGYGIKELLQKLAENCLVILCEAEDALYEFSEAEGILKSSDSRVLAIPPEKLSELPLEIYKLAKSGIYKRLIRLDLSAGVQFNSDFYSRLFSASSDSLMTFWKNRITLTKFGRRYSKNLFENLHYLSKTKPIADFFGSIDKPIIVFGAGESTQGLINRLQLNVITNEVKQSIPKDFYILCADTALQPLLKNGIRPDGVFIEEAQSVIMKAFIGALKASPSGSTRIFAGLSSLPNLVHKAGSENTSFFFTEYAEGSFFDSLKEKAFMPPANLPFGSVGLTAVYYALKFRKSEEVPVYIAGLDFSYKAGLTHTKGALAHILRLVHANRLVPPQNYAAAYGLGAEKISGKDSCAVITTPTLKSYAAMFQSYFSGRKNLFDAGKSGIDLGLPAARIDSFLADAPRKSEKVREAETPGNSFEKEIDNFLTGERRALGELRDLLTGHTELKGEALLAEIKKLASPREYLYLHFADGFKFSLDQSFLNRIRVEIDYFLKIFLS